MKYLWTLYNYMEQYIPNINNSLEEYFKHLKTYLNTHSSLSFVDCENFIYKYFAKEYENIHYK